MIKRILFLLLVLASTNLFSQDVNIDLFATGFNSPVAIENAGDDRLFIVEQDGVIKILNANGTTNATPFLNINSIVGSGGNEQGLLGLAFDPDYSTNGYFYVNYTNNSGDTVIARYSVSGNPNVANSGSAQILLTVSQPYSNHNGGDIAFGSDGYLYIGMGDGGSGGDPQNYAQNGSSLLGKMLRIEVGSASTYSVPADNPFVGDGSVLDEVWAIGLRNPWRFTFDSQNGDMWIADVGQSGFEEINHASASLGSPGSGWNYGWRCYEATSTFNTSGCLPASNYNMPVAQYQYGGSPFRCSITGGHVYRGSQYPDFVGLYFFADYCSDEIGTVDPNNSYQVTFNGGFNGGISSFGEDVNGELYISTRQNGRIYKIKDDTLSIDENVLLNDITVNPNPAKDHVTIESQSGDYKIKNIEVFNVIGARVKAAQANSVTQYQLNLQDLKEGIYFLKIELSNKNSIVKKLIVK